MNFYALSVSKIDILFVLEISKHTVLLHKHFSISLNWNPEKTWGTLRIPKESLS